MFFLPYRGAAQKMRPKLTTVTMLSQLRNKGLMNDLRNSGMVAAAEADGPLSAMTTAPMMHRAQPILPKKVSFSLRKMEERMAL